MPTTRDVKGSLLLGGVRLSELLSRPAVGSPTYVYDLDGIAADARALREAFGAERHLVAYAVKANSAGPIVRRLAAEGCGADVVSGGELRLALACGVAPSSIVFSGVAKQDWELDEAMAAGVHAIQAESVEELARIAARAGDQGRVARVSLRLNPEVERESLDTHSHIATGHDEAKFGIAGVDVPRALVYVRGAPALSLVGLSSHVGSQFTSTAPYTTAARKLFALARAVVAAGWAPLEFVDSGGGFGVDYGDGCPVRPADFVRATLHEKAEAGLGHLALYVEPGRSLVAPHGVLLARVVQEKRAGERRWVFLDAGMNDLLRPALYQARHRIVALEEHRPSSVPPSAPPARTSSPPNVTRVGSPPPPPPDASDSPHAPHAPHATDAAASPEPRRSPSVIPRVERRVAGPVCESADDFGSYVLPLATPGSVAILDVGAYGYVMASRYNGRPLPAEIFLEDGRAAFVIPRGDVGAWVDERVGALRFPAGA